MEQDSKSSLEEKKKKRSIYCSLGADDYGEVESKGAIGGLDFGFFSSPVKIVDPLNNNMLLLYVGLF